jgi:FkbM family methyltransferase
MADGRTEPQFGAIKLALKKLRASQPFNYIASSTIRFLATAADLESEFVIKHLPKVGTVRSSLPNGSTLSFWTRGDDWVANQVYWRGWSGYEPEASSLFFRLARCSRVVIDVGAHVGFYSLLAGHANPHAQVYAFEPLPATSVRLRRNIRLNRLQNVEAIQCAIGDIDGPVDFCKPSVDIPCSAGMSFDFYKPWADELKVTTVRVESIRIDSFVLEHSLPLVDLVKIDTETTEPRVIAGMTETIKQHHPLIVCEVLKGCGSEKALEDLLIQHGYRFYLLTPRGAVFQEHIEGHDEWLNYLFATLDPGEVANL